MVLVLSDLNGSRAVELGFLPRRRQRPQNLAAAFDHPDRRERIVFRVIPPEQCTPRGIRGTPSAGQASAATTRCCFYATSHGGYDPRRGHFLASARWARGAPRDHVLFVSDLLAVLREADPQAVFVVADAVAPGGMSPSRKSRASPAAAKRHRARSQRHCRPVGYRPRVVLLPAARDGMHLTAAARG